MIRPAAAMRLARELCPDLDARLLPWAATLILNRVKEDEIEAAQEEREQEEGSVA